LISVLAFAGCGSSELTPYPARGDKFTADHVVFSGSTDLVDHVAIGTITRSFDSSGILHVTVPARATTPDDLYVDYRCHLFRRESQSDRCVPPPGKRRRCTRIFSNTFRRTAPHRAPAISRSISARRSKTALILSVTTMQKAVRADEDSPRWPAEKANAWYAKQPWLVGCNYIPRTAINQLEMWQADTFDPKTIDQELGWARHIGFNTLRVYLHDKAWAADPEGFKKRIDGFLNICSSHQHSAYVRVFRRLLERDF